MCSCCARRPVIDVVHHASGCCPHVQVARAVLPTLVAEEGRWLEANRHSGPHKVIQHPHIRMWWWRSFGTSEEVPWAFFWTCFPKNLDGWVTHVCWA